MPIATGPARSAGYLLDTHVCLWATADPDQLSRSVKSALQRGPNFISVITYWEVVLKGAKGRLSVGEPREWWAETLRALAATPVTLQPAHIARIAQLPPIHADPFDRALIAQASEANLTLLSSDAEIAKYSRLGCCAVLAG